MARILVVDDEEHLRNIYFQYLTLDGHTVQTAVDGVDAMKYLESEKYDLLLTDIIMPEQDGLWLLTRFRSLAKFPKVIVVTGGSPKLDLDFLVKLADGLKANKVLIKPVTYAQLKSAVTEVLEFSGAEK